MRIEVIPVAGLPEIEEGDDLASVISQHAEVRDGDVVVVAQKIVSKAEGRVIEIDPARSREERSKAVAQETARVVARRGDIVISQTRHGFVCANAGVDASNVPPDRLALLPLDPDGSAERLRAGLNSSLGARVGVVVSDTFGRAWRIGQTNVALGVAGIKAARDHRGEKDSFGMELEATIIAIADEIAGAAELVMGKSDGIPVAIVRGLEGAEGEGTARELIRPPDEDLFAVAGVEVIEARRSVRAFDERTVPHEVVARAVEAAGTAPAPHGSRSARPWRFVWLKSSGPRKAFLSALRERWRTDLASDGIEDEIISHRIKRSNEILEAAPVLIACFVSLAAADRYPDERRARAERDMFVAAGGAAVQNLMVALAAQSVGSCWISSSVFAPEVAARTLGLGPEWHAIGCVAAGYPSEAPAARKTGGSQDLLDIR
jgi:coenzyme F420-0:L-glutamate ligase/coenzyme F420-1:gamma-L-glutamate ligase